ILVGLYVSNIICSVLFALAFLIAKFVFDTNPVQAIFGVMVAMIVLTLEILIFYKAANVSISGMLFSMVFFIFTFITTILSGGWTSPIMMIFFVTPAVSFLVGGRQEGFYTAALVLFTGTGFKVADQMGIQVFQIVPESDIELVRITIWVISLVVLVSCLTVYDALLETHIKK
ncbi:MAG: hypothetical protein KDI30_01995, partial [Pseudomonadales bacterium]|nr:hypothetical protein [Pseudomonadales bacterium]